MDIVKVTHTTTCKCNRGPAPHGVGVVCAGVCDACIHDGAIKFMTMMGAAEAVMPMVRTGTAKTDHVKNWGF